MRLGNMVGLITGAALGVGAGIAERFSEAGASVAIFDIDDEAARRLEQKLRRTGHALALLGEVSMEERSAFSLNVSKSAKANPCFTYFGNATILY
jgi:NAD(P)-dependent dehydrogenase (short-subunit alcohol dehydrogenase family)